MRRSVLPALVIGHLVLGSSAASNAADRKDREFQECPECPVMVGIPAGTFARELALRFWGTAA
jgi:hypothetical protein